MRKLRILIADDHVSVRKGICSILGSRVDIEICAEAENGEEAVRMARELKPDIVFMDFTMPVMDGLEASKQILQIFPEMAILMFSMHRMDTLTKAAKDIGVRGFVIKGQSTDNLLKAVDKVVRSEPFFILNS
jgi:two-component system, NarL family, nitrate/nitrite response regulator NarL